MTNWAFKLFLTFSLPLALQKHLSLVFNVFYSISSLYRSIHSISNFQPLEIYPQLWQ
ncbi:hypothetical protein NC652_018832 [Populus alba x Populus x berolinensis]|nr:hypothetical protein NC652_018832 [Populus alba x Populus x berolinensis]